MSGSMGYLDKILPQSQMYELHNERTHKFTNTDLSKTNLEEANLTNTYFSPALYDGLSIFKADLRHAELDNLDIRRVDLSGVKLCEWQQDYIIDNLGIILYKD